MAHNFQTSTLYLTLPISCQICLGKVRQPVICANHHVFCSSCMKMWLKKASQCPTCRVAITAETPCREILGGTNESDHSESPSVRKCLRKTRGELLLREYEEEIEGVIRENEDLKMKNQSLELQLKTALDPCSITPVQTDDKKVDPYILEECTNKLRAAQDVCDQVKQDLDKLKEANKTLRSQNVDLVQENMRLKAEVVSRSPQKFGRYTVAALEAKIQQYERDMDHLKRALERSDQYIEELETRVRKFEKRPSDSQKACGGSRAASEALTQQQKINMMMRSLSDNERVSICSNPEVECRTFSRNSSVVMSSAEHAGFDQSPSVNQRGVDSVSTSSDFLPSTPSSAFRSLTLRSPGVREKKVAFKPASYLRRLDFDGIPSPGKVSSSTENPLNSLDKFPKGFSSNSDTESGIWGPWQRSKSVDHSCAGSSKESFHEGSTSSRLVADEADRFQKSSEASMDAAFLDKISELDSMMLEGESSSSRGSQLSLASSPAAELDNTLIPETHGCDDKQASECGQQSHGSCDTAAMTDKGALKAGESCSSLGSDGELAALGCGGRGGAPHTEELSFDLLFDALEENEAGSSGGSLSPAGHCHGNSSSSCTGKPVKTPRDTHTLNSGQPTKRKSHSPFNTSSPTKLSKLM